MPVNPPPRPHRLAQFFATFLKDPRPVRRTRSMDLTLDLCRQLARRHHYRADQIAAARRVSPRTLRRRWRALRQRRPLRLWLQRLRLADALRLLRAGQPVKYVAYTLGYRHPAAFIAAFRRRYRHAPAAFRAAHRAGERPLAAPRNPPALPPAPPPANVHPAHQSQLRTGPRQPPPLG